jgi:hypothetical protein
MGWRENGKWLAMPLLMSAARNADDPRQKFLQGIRDYAKSGDPTKLASYLSSAPAGGQVEREMLAIALEARQQRAPRNGRPPETPEKLVANMSLGFYQAWRLVNALCGDRSRGHTEEMKDEAASYVIEIWLRHLPITNNDELYEFWERVRSLMNREPARRKLPARMKASFTRLTQIFNQNPWH